MDKVIFEGLGFNNVMLIPRYSEVQPDAISFKTRLTAEISLNIPLISAPMDTVTEWELAAALAREGGIGFIHKSMTSDEQAQHIFRVKNTDSFGFDNAVQDDRKRLLVGAAVGTSRDVLERVETLVDAGVDIVSVETSNGHSLHVMQTIEKIKKKFPDLPVVGGNIATPEAVKDLVSAGADCVKVGIGPGTMSTTRAIAGVGVPQITAVLRCAEEANKQKVSLISDGGIKTSGEVAKALAAGANAVMLGSMFAGTEESPGESITSEGRRYKAYRGMGSKAAMRRAGKDRYFQTGSKEYVLEGVEGLVPYAGTVESMIYEVIGGLRAAMAYCGAADIDVLREKAQFVRIADGGFASNIDGTL